MAETLQERVEWHADNGELRLSIRLLFVEVHLALATQDAAIERLTCEWNRAQAMLDLQADTITRLTRERDGAKVLLGLRADAIERLTRERDEAERTLQRTYDERDEARAERSKIIFDKTHEVAGNMLDAIRNTVFVVEPGDRVVVVDLFPVANLTHPHLWWHHRADGADSVITHGWPPLNTPTRDND